jgi:hypothetical protein
LTDCLIRRMAWSRLKGQHMCEQVQGEHFDIFVRAVV